MKTFTTGAIIGALALSSSSAGAAQNSDTCGMTYAIVAGDTLSKISKKHYGSTDYKALYQHNARAIGKNANRIFVGQQIEIPCLDSEGTILTKVESVIEKDEEIAVVVKTEAVGAGDTAVSDTKAAASETLVFTFNKTSAPPFIINSGIIDLYLAEISEVTEGRVTFVDPEVMNRAQSDQFALVTSGEVDGTYVLNEFLRDTHPFLQLPSLPLMGGSAEQTAVSMWRLHDTYMAQTDYFPQAKLMGFVAAPAAHIWRDAAMPIKSDENIVDKNVYPVPYFQGLDVRGPKALRQEVAEWSETYRAENADPATYFLAHGAARALGIWNEEIVVTEVDNGLYTPTFSVLLSNQAWAQISPADQDAIMEISGEKLSHRSASWDAFDNGFRSDMLRKGLNTVKADADLLAELRDHTNKHISTWSTYADGMGIMGLEAVAFYQENLAKLEDRLIFK